MAAKMTHLHYENISDLFIEYHCAELFIDEFYRAKEQYIVDVAGFWLYALRARSATNGWIPSHSFQRATDKKIPYILKMI